MDNLEEVAGTCQRDVAAWPPSCCEMRLRVRIRLEQANPGSLFYCPSRHAFTARHTVNPSPAEPM